MVFVSFSHYITLPAPWNYGSATLVVLCTVVLVYLHVMDMARSLGRVVTHGLAIGGAVGGALLVGAPTFVLLFPLLTGSTFPFVGVGDTDRFVALCGF